MSTDLLKIIKITMKKNVINKTIIVKTLTKTITWDQNNYRLYTIIHIFTFICFATAIIITTSFFFAVVASGTVTGCAFTTSFIFIWFLCCFFFDWESSEVSDWGAEFKVDRWFAIEEWGAECKVDRWFAIAEYWGSEGKVGIMFVIARGWGADKEEEAEYTVAWLAIAENWGIDTEEAGAYLKMIFWNF